MDFYEVLDQVIDLLQRHGRVSYRALKRQFSVDDTFLADLIDELVEIQQIATSQDDRMLVWTGETEETPLTTSQPDRFEPQPVVEQAQPVRETSSPVEPHTPDAERRQLTVMFVDLVGSTSLSGELDPEDYREVVRQYQRVCSEVIQRYDGHVAQLLGDGLLVYFGYPVAHEDDAQRAVRSGLGILQAIETLNNGLKQKRHIELSVRLGIHTGLVVVGEMGGEGRQEQLALGETPNIAARIQGLAEPDTVVISAETYRLAQGYFDCELLGEHELRGVTEPVNVHRVLQASGIQSRLEATDTLGLTPLVGREQELGLLWERWEQSCEGNGQVILLSGEAGIGKSRLVQALKEHVADELHAQEECRCSPYHTNSAFFPLADLLQRKLSWQPEDTADEKLYKLETVLAQTHLDVNTAVPLFTTLLSLPLPDDRYSLIELSSQEQRQQTLEAFLQLVLLAAEQHPVLFIVEDLHWVDPSTLEFLELLIDQTPTTAIFVLFTCRPQFQPTWSHRSYLTEISLNRLSRPQVEQIATQVASGKALPTDVIEQLVDKTDGVPLYVEEMTKAVLESGILKEIDGQYVLTGPVASLSIPTTLQDSLMARLDRLVTAKGIAQMGATIGRQFSYKLLRAVSEVDEETAYGSLLRSTRQQYHAKIATVLESRFPDTAETQPELLAHHHTEADLAEQAIDYWQQAGQRASERSAYQEAISHLTTGLDLLQTLPETLERHRKELPLQTALGAASLFVRGHAAPEVEAAYTRARVLYQQLGDTQDVFPVLWGLWRFYVAQSNYPLARQLGENLLILAERHDEPSLYVLAHYALGITCICLGELLLAYNHFEEGIARYSPEQRNSPMFRAGQDPGVTCLAYAACMLWQLGYPDQALARAHDALALTGELDHLYSDAFALCGASVVRQWRREGPEAYSHATTAVTLSTQQGFPYWLAFGTVLLGWALMTLGQGEEGLRQMRQGLADYRAAGTELFVSYLLTLLAEGHGNLKQFDEGFDVLKEGLEIIERTGEHWCEAELHRLKGQLLLQQSSDNATDAESCFHQAMTIAQNQSAKSWELRASTTLAKLWQSQGKRDDARALLAPVYNWFTEGFDTADLIDAKTLLDELTEGQP